MNKLEMTMLDEDEKGNTLITLNGKQLSAVQEVNIAIIAGKTMPLVTLKLYADVLESKLAYNTAATAGRPVRMP